MLAEARRRRSAKQAAAARKTEFKRDTRARFERLDGLSQSRIAALIKHYTDGSPKPTGIDKESIGVYAGLGLRHFHINQNHADPLLKYAIRPGRFIFLAIDDHAAKKSS